MLVFSFGTGMAQRPGCRCRKVPNDMGINEGNVDALMTGGKIKKLRGKVLYPNGEIVKNAIIEVYDNFTKSDDWEKINKYEITSRPLRIACMTDDDGNFCISGIPPGKYLLKVGIHENIGISAIYVLVSLDPKGRRSSNKELEISLPQSI
jgi:protocatechuate 3,4-dioxygenase beta subunit